MHFPLNIYLSHSKEVIFTKNSLLKMSTNSVHWRNDCCHGKLIVHLHFFTNIPVSSVEFSDINANLNSTCLWVHSFILFDFQHSQNSCVLDPDSHCRLGVARPSDTEHAALGVQTDTTASVCVCACRGWRRGTAVSAYGRSLLPLSYAMKYFRRGT